MFFIAGSSCHAFNFSPQDLFSSSQSVSDKTALRIYGAVARTKTLKTDKFRATFEKDGNLWTITGAYAPIVAPRMRPVKWPVFGNALDVQVISKPISNQKILPWTKNLTAVSADGVIRIKGCPGEYEPASFVLRSGDQDLKNISIAVSDLELASTEEQHNGNRIAKKNIDIRVVKCWYQAGTELWVKDKLAKTLTPELLLKDDGIIEVNHEYQVNLVKNFEAVQDSEKLKPFFLGKQENKQIWITLYIPDTAKPGTYSGEVRVNADGKITKNIPLELEVLPFKLDASIINYSMFYDAELLPKSGQFNITSQKRTETKMFIELEDMRKHGINNPVITMKTWNQDNLAKVLKLRKKAGISNDKIYYVTWPGLKDDQTYMTQVTEHCRNAVQLMKSLGVKEIYFYGFDELHGDKLHDAISFYRDFKEYGAKIFVAGANTFFITLGSSIDLPVIWGQGGNIDWGKLKGLVEQAHKAGKKIWIYSFPQNGKEEPDTYRRNFGLSLWRLGIDGACNYAYQAWMHHPWDDFDHPVFRDEVITYPTVKGIILTIQWEGWREGVKDIKYLSTLIRIKNEIKDQSLRERIDYEVASIDINGDLDSIRDRLIDLIIQGLQL